MQACDDLVISFDDVVEGTETVTISLIAEAPDYDPRRLTTVLEIVDDGE